MKYYAQLFIVGYLVTVLLVSLHVDFYGRSAKEPGGYSGAVITLVLVALITLLYLAAGALSEIW